MMPIAHPFPPTGHDTATTLPGQGQDWIQSSLGDDELAAISGDASFTSIRIWQGFMTARLMVALLLLALQGLETYFHSASPAWLLAMCAVYAAFALSTRLGIAPVTPGKSFERYWPATLGLDLLVYFLLVWFGQSDMANYIPLLALPPVMSAVLGTRRITVLTVILSSVLMGLASWQGYRAHSMDSQITRYAMLALYMLTMFLIASVLHRVSRHYGLQQIQSRTGHKLLRLQGRIQDMVVQSVRDGVLVVGGSGRLRAINQAAQQMLHMPKGQPAIGKPVDTIAEMGPLLHLIRQSFEDAEGVSSEVFLFPSDEQSTHLMVHSRMSASASVTPDDEPLCLLYLQDMQELQNQVRTEKLAAMGRMSAAVAHEIRNPLAAIGQAAQLLDEELEQPLQKKLNGMIRDNAQRLGRIVHDVLDIARLQQHPPAEAPVLGLDTEVKQLCEEWLQQHPPTGQVRMTLHAPHALVRFEPDHLRRVMVNLLDNAWQHARQGSDACVVVSTHAQNGAVRLQVWSRGTALPPAILGRLFEPFAAGPSRSTGLGLYICRELCRRHRADIHYQRLPAPHPPNEHACGQEAGTTEEGNAFFVDMPTANTPHNPAR